MAQTIHAHWEDAAAGVHLDRKQTMPPGSHRQFRTRTSFCLRDGDLMGTKTWKQTFFLMFNVKECFVKS